MKPFFLAALALSAVQCARQNSTAPSSVQSESSYCSGSEVQEVQRPYYPGDEDAESPNFPYRFRVQKGKPSAPWVVFLPGGPGQVSMQANRRLGIPEDWNVLWTDPRGVGCNTVDKIDRPEDFFSTRNLSSDIVAALKKLNLKEFFLYGVSYGTQLATVLAAQWEAEGGSGLKAVVLDGVIGKFDGEGEIATSYLEQWEQVKARLAPALQERLNAATPPLGHTSREWSLWIQRWLRYGTIPYPGSSGETFDITRGLDGLDPSASKDDRDYLDEDLSRTKEGSTESATEILYRYIACREISTEVHSSHEDAYFDFVKGRLVFKPGTTCSGLKLSSLFDSAQYSIRAPIIYFEGERDPSTPPKQARYPYEHQTSKRVYVDVKKGGHAVLAIGLTDCQEKVWLQIAQDPGALDAALSTCTLKSEQTKSF